MLSAPGEDAFENAISGLLGTFMYDVFGCRGSGKFPALDDIFTCLDISTNSGHHLGLKYSPVYLRAIRRFLVYRVFSVLEKGFSWSAEVEELISKLYVENSDVDYVVLNWDIVLEKYTNEIFPHSETDYCNDGTGG
jgi:hypothetical protein